MNKTIPFRQTPYAEDDVSLLARARSGDGTALDALLQRHLADVYDVAFRVLGDRDLAEDATQDAMVSALGALRSFRGDASFRTWLLRIALNAARGVGRRQRRRSEVSLTLVETRPGREPDPAQRAVDRAEADRVSAQLARLPEKQRLAVTLRVSQELSYKEIGQAIGCTEGAARVNYHLGMKRLRELLK